MFLSFILKTKTSEIQYLFKGANVFGPVPLSHKQMQLSEAMVSYGTQFAKTGNPNSSAEPAWAPYSASGDEFQSLIRLPSSGVAWRACLGSFRGKFSLKNLALREDHPPSVLRWGQEVKIPACRGKRDKDEAPSELDLWKGGADT